MIPKGQSLFILVGFNNLTSEWRIIYSSLFKSKKREEEVIKEKSKDYLFLIPYEVNNKYSIAALNYVYNNQHLPEFSLLFPSKEVEEEPTEESS